MTVNGAAITGSLAATSICSTLSLQACQGLQSQYCSAYGTGSTGAVGAATGTTTAGAAAFTSLGIGERGAIARVGKVFGVVVVVMRFVG